MHTTSTIDELIEEGTQVGVVTTLLESFNFLARGRMNLRGLSQKQKYVVASQIPNVEAELKQIVNGFYPSDIKQDANDAISYIKKIKSYTSQIPSDKQLSVKQATDVVTAMDNISKFEKLKNESNVEAIKQDYEAKIKLENDKISNIINSPNETNQATPTEPQQPAEATPTEQAQEAVQTENRNAENVQAEESGVNDYIKNKIRDLYDTALNVRDRVVKEFIRPVTNNEIQNIKDVTGIEIDEEYEHTIDNSAINHILKKHGNNSSEESRGQIAVTKDDFELIPDIISDYDTIEKGGKNEKGLDTILYTKTFPNGVTYIVEEVRTGKKELALNTMYKRKSSGFVPTDSIPSLTSETTLDNTNIQNNPNTNQNPTQNENTETANANTQVNQQSEQGTTTPYNNTTPTTNEASNASLQTNQTTENKVEQPTETQSPFPTFEEEVSDENNNTELDSFANDLFAGLTPTQNEGTPNTTTETNGAVRPTNSSTQQEGQEGQADTQNTQPTTNNGASEGNVSETNPLANTEYTHNGRKYNRQSDGGFTRLDDNGVERKVTNSKTLNALNKLYSERREQSVIDKREKDGYTLKRYADGSAVIINSKGTEINERKKDGSLNANFSNALNKVFGEKTDGQIEVERRDRIREMILNLIPPNERQAVMLYLASGGKVNKDYISEKLLGNSKKLEARGKKRKTIEEFRWAWFTNDRNVPSGERIAETIREGEWSEMNFDEQTLRNEVDDILFTYSNVGDIQDELVDLYNKQNDPYYGMTEEDIRGMALGNLSPRELAMVQDIEAEMSMPESERFEYYKQEFENKIQSLSDEEQDQLYRETEFNNRGANPTNDTRTNEGVQSESTSLYGRQEQNKSEENRTSEEGNEGTSGSGRQETNTGRSEILQRESDSLYAKPESDGLQLQRGNVAKNYISLPIFEKVIERFKNTFKNAFKNLNVTYDWDEFVKRHKKLGKFGSIQNAFDSKRMRNANARFNNELKQMINGILPSGHIFQIGMPSAILRASGIPNLPIEMSSARLKTKAMQENHQFDLSEVENLPNAIQNPIAVFSYGDKTKSVNIITELQDKNGKKYLVGIHFNQERNGLIVNSIRGIFPKDNAEWLNWISQNKSLYLNKEKVQTLITQQQTNLADLSYLDLNSIANIIKNFQNPITDEGINDVKFQIGDDFRDSHSAPAMEWDTFEEAYEEAGSFNLSEIATDRHNVPEEFFSSEEYANRMFGYAHARESIKSIFGIKRKLSNGADPKTTTVKVYRAVPNNVNLNHLIQYDWVSLAKGYAVQHGESRFGEGEYKIIEQEVPIHHIWWDGNDINEWGYDPSNDIRFMHTPNGQVYGAKLPDGTIYFNPELLNMNTAFHEFSHLWEQMMPRAWAKGLELFKQTKTGKELFAQLKREGNYSTLTDKELWSEAMNTYIGERGAELYEKKPRGVMAQFKDWLSDVFYKLGQAFGVKKPLTPFTTFEEFADRVIGDIQNGRELLGENHIPKSEIPNIIKAMTNTDLEQMLTDMGVIQKGMCA